MGYFRFNGSKDLEILGMGVGVRVLGGQREGDEEIRAVRMRN